MSSSFDEPVGSQASISLALPPNKQKTINVNEGLIVYAEALQVIDENNPLAKLNAVSISDNNGGRIFF